VKILRAWHRGFLAYCHQPTSHTQEAQEGKDQHRGCEKEEEEEKGDGRWRYCHLRCGKEEEKETQETEDRGTDLFYSSFPLRNANF
jgi:hypothetical protein